MKSRRAARVVAVFATVSMLGLLTTTNAWSAAPPSFTGPGIGPQPKGLGMGSKAALAQDSCTENGRTSFALEGTGPFCVNPWPAGKNNGGATAQGVTKDSVKVVIYIENPQMAAAGSGSQAPTDQATGKTAPVSDAIRDTLKEYQHAQDALHTYQTWGRTIDFQVFEASGPDETAQRADATAIASMKPFMVYDQTRWATGGAPALASALAAKKIVVVSASTTPKIGSEQAPYRWANAADDAASIPLTASFVGRSLAGDKAQWAGDSDLKSKTRSFGIVYPIDSTFDFASLQQQLAKNGAPKLAASVGFDPNNAQQASEQAATSVLKFKGAGVTSVILFAPGPLVTALMTNASQQDYHPEWVFTGYQYQDYDGFARNYPQDQMKAAFGLSILWPYSDPQGLVTDGFRWYWGKTQGAYSTTVPAVIGFVYGSVQYAGPTLTAENVRKGWFSVPPTTSLFGQSGYGKTTGMPYEEYAASGTDRALAFWDGDTTALSQAGPPSGKGVFQYVDGGKRYTFSTMPKTQPKFFDMKGAVYQVPYSAGFPDGVVPNAVPCNGCPSSGGTP
ncbi:MAG TPA: hypothetical protein VH986_07650 [Acidimicrobiia bacterium]|jgi:hypothetical protein